MTKVYLLFYDTDTGAREEWNTFYTPCEVFTNPEDRQKRIEHIKKLAAQLDEGEFEFHENEVDVMNENTIYDNPFDY
jgi:hypothetical protein